MDGPTLVPHMFQARCWPNPNERSARNRFSPLFFFFRIKLNPVANAKQDQQVGDHDNKNRPGLQKNYRYPSCGDGLHDQISPVKAKIF